MISRTLLRFRLMLAYKLSGGKWNAIRRNPDGSVDDVAISCDMFRLEQMARDLWWCAAYRGGKQTSFMLGITEDRQSIWCNLTEDELGCHDDSTAYHA